ncbi:putative TGF beta receptor associated protein 1 [Aspergillus undulatus]|uniref:putative TGF beta receptor associated protein 1 n=1 Tax=Aspergillus undulatus TaxID=1810928 RepID=UPI003CCCD80C
MAEEEGIISRKRHKVGPPKAAPYIFKPLFDQVPVTADDAEGNAHITCVEYWSDNLYIGTSAAEILHFVCLPPDPSGGTNEPSFILASRLPIPFSQKPSPLPHTGVQQILVLPTVNKACVLCNGTATFYMLPELSPAFGDNTKVNNCRWIGGLDLNIGLEEPENLVVMIATHTRLMLVKIGDAARMVRGIEFPGCLASVRRGIISCVADNRNYSLLDVEHQQKIPLFPMSFADEMLDSGQVEDMLAPSGVKSPQSAQSGSPAPEAQGHGRSSSLNTLAGMLQPTIPPRSSSKDRSRSLTPELSEMGTPRRSTSRERSRDTSPRASSRESSENPSQEPQPTAAEEPKPLPPLPKPPAELNPHILSPTSSEFLLVRGTDETEPGVGMFVNVDGDVVRGTITFHRYPKSIIIDKGDETNMVHSMENTKDDFILALMESDKDGQTRRFMEVQPWDVDPAEADDHKSWVEIPSVQDNQSKHVGISQTLSPSDLEVQGLGRLLQMVRLKTPPLSSYTPAADPRTQASIEQLQKEKELFESQELTESEEAKKKSWEAERNAEEAKIAQAMGKTRSSLVMWAGNRIWRIVRNPLTTQLAEVLRNSTAVLDNGHLLDRDAVWGIIETVQQTEPKSESEFIGLNFLKQKASLLLLGDLLFMDPEARNDTVIDTTEKALIVGDLDPRIAMILIPLLRTETLQSSQGLWVHAGLAETAEEYLRQTDKAGKSLTGFFNAKVLNMMKRFLLSWQQKRGYGSIPDETYVFDSVDAALLRLLLAQSTTMTQEQIESSGLRDELNKLVDKWKGNFDHAVALLESYQRLWVLSRLYQSRKMSGNVLKTWRRIIEGEEDVNGDFSPAGVEEQMRKYLGRIRDVQLVEEYGSWLAQRNPKLGIQVFADKSSRVILDPSDAVALLKERAPNAVQEYLEHLVFTKHYTQYADDLLQYYLDTVISVLEESPEARTSLSESYSTYRALRPPKPTYMNFITENLPSDPWWQSRMRLLQLLGGGSTTQFTSAPTPSLNYSIPTVLARIEPFQNELVSESIILDGLQGRHREALRLLTHGLGDYDAATRYCLFGGPRSTSSTGTPLEFADKSRQSELFRYLLDEFLQIRDLSERIDRTSDLLGRFAAWFDVREVLSIIPDDWSVEILNGFLAHVFRVLVSESREAKIERALSAGQNLRVAADYISGMEKVGGWVENEEGLKQLRGNGKISAGRETESDFGDIVEAGES